MAIFRVERTRDYTVMCNHHLKDMNLSLKAKGLLSMMLSLPDTWNYTTRGLAAICKEGVDAIGSTVRELEAAGYIIRRLLRGANGRITDTEYIIYEQPRGGPDTPPPGPSGSDAPPPHTGGPDAPSPHTDFSYAAGSCAAGPDAKTTTQLNTYPENTNRSNTNLSRPTEGNARGGAPGGVGCADEEAVRLERARIRAQIEYDCITNVENREQVDEFVEIMLAAGLTESPTIRIGRGREYPTALVRERFRQINSSHIERLLDAILENRVPVRNTKAYLLAALFDAPASKDNYYTMAAASSG